ncbi:MAG: MBL fold metallo-hydrolase [Acidimicrobiales bacterium]
MSGETRDASLTPVVVVLGCDGSYPGPGGAGSGYLLNYSTTSVLLDAGPGVFANLQKVQDPDLLDAVVLSHEHPDHRSDVDSLALFARHKDRRRPVDVYAPPGLREKTYYGDDTELCWHVVEPSYQIEIGELSLRFVATDHGPPTLAVRVEAASTELGSFSGGVLAYSADTGADWSLEELGVGIDTFLCEATYTHVYEGTFRHLSGRQAGALAAGARVEKLLLTHRWPTVSKDDVEREVREEFGGSVHSVRIGETIPW